MVETPTVRAQGGSGQALTREMLVTLESEAVTNFLLARRWFGAKGGRPTGARFRDVIPLPWDGGRMVVATIDVTLGEDRVASYQVPLAYMAAPNDPRGVLARVEGGGMIVDAVEDSQFLEGLARSLSTGATFAEGSTRWVFEPLGDAGSQLAGQRPRVGSAEQSNTSIIFGDRAILKLFRRLEPGDNPDVEIGRFLTKRTSFRGTPALLGIIRLESAQGSSVAGMVQAFVAGTGDAWSYAVASARQQFGAPEDEEPETAFVTDARELGRITRELHDALASDSTHPEFAPRPATAEDVHQWVGDAKRSIDEGFALLDKAMVGVALPDETMAAARVLLRRRAEFPALVDEIEEHARDDAGARIRHHGDYHLGQVLRTPDSRFMIIDFEGEPARPLAERRARHCPLRDVAGMLRSFAYAAATAATDRELKAPRGIIEIRAGRWQRDVRKAFLGGYFTSSHASGPRFLPRHKAATAGLTSLFEIDKVFYELKYELNNRPDWVWIPLRGIARLTEAVAAGDA